MFFYPNFIYQILNRYRTYLPLEDTVAINFTGVANERPVAAFTHPISEDALLMGAFVNFTTATGTVRIRSTSPQYDFMANNDVPTLDTPINAIAGVNTQAMPVMPWPIPFFVEKQGRLQLQFQNDASAPVTGGLFHLRGIRLTNPVDSRGWSYDLGFFPS